MPAGTLAGVLVFAGVALAVWLIMKFVNNNSTQTPEYLVGFDFDCTLTVKHFFIVFAYGYGGRNMEAHAHCQVFKEWCDENKIDPLAENLKFKDNMVGALDDFCRRAGEDRFKDLFRKVFLGGEERIKYVAKWLEQMDAKGVRFAIVTRGTSASVLRALNGVPEWSRFFPLRRIWAHSQRRLHFQSIAGDKAGILRELMPGASKILLVDDDLSKNPPRPWELDGTQVDTFDKLPYEGQGVNQEHLQEIHKRLFG